MSSNPSGVTAKTSLTSPKAIAESGIATLQRPEHPLSRAVANTAEHLIGFLSPTGCMNLAHTSKTLQKAVFNALLADVGPASETLTKAAPRKVYQEISRTDPDLELKVHPTGFRVFLKPDAESIELSATLPNLPAHVTENLSRHPNPEVRLAISKNPNTAPSALERLSEDMAENQKMKNQIRTSAAQHPNLPVSHMRYLAKNYTSNLIFDDHINDFRHPAELYGLSKNPSLPADMIDSLMTHENTGLRVNLAMHPSTTAKQLRTLARLEKDNTSTWVKSEIAANPRTPNDLLIRYYLSYEDSDYPLISTTAYKTLMSKLLKNR